MEPVLLLKAPYPLESSERAACKIMFRDMAAYELLCMDDCKRQGHVEEGESGADDDCIQTIFLSDFCICGGL